MSVTKANKLIMAANAIYINDQLARKVEALPALTKPKASYLMLGTTLNIYH